MTAPQPAFSLNRPTPVPVQESGCPEVVVLHTTTKATLRSLRTAAGLAAGLASRIRILVLEVVPYPLYIGVPRVSLDFTKRRFRTVASDARVDTLVDIRLGRNRRRMLESALNPGSVVVLERAPWWTPEHRLAKRVERLGYQVVLTNPN